jgi:hypothetical protein
VHMADVCALMSGGSVFHMAERLGAGTQKLGPLDK